MEHNHTLTNANLSSHFTNLTNLLAAGNKSLINHGMVLTNFSALTNLTDFDLLASENESSHHEHGNGTHIIMEGGFLSGRNPFTFNSHFPLPTFIVQLVVIVCMSRIVKLFLSPIKQPAVIAETISGILLGPTCMGHIPYFSETIFPPPSLPFLNLMSNFGLVLFLFLVGLELDPRMLKKSIRSSLAISLTGMGLPFGLGAGVSYILYNMEPVSHQNGFTKYFLFLGVAMAITAFPVLARILTELNLLKTKVGGITISAAAVDDATSWCLLALVISLINAGSGLIALYVFLMGLGYSLFLVFGVRPIFVWILRRSGAFENEPSQVMMFLTLTIVFISAFITDAIGIHAIFGGFLAGIIMPHEGGFAYHITEKLEDIVAILFLPLYFALSGLRTSIGSLNDAVSWGVVVLVICVACFGKIFGCTLAARVTRMNWRESITVGCLMNCKGLVELIVLNLGYDAQVISQRTFAIMVIMALVTTFITVPLVSFIYPPKYHDKIEEPDHTPGSKGKKSHGNQPSLLVSVNKIEQVPAILSIIHLLQSKKFNTMSELNQRKTSSQSERKASTTHNNHNHPVFIPLPNNCLKPQKYDVEKHHGKSHHHERGHGVVINALRLIELTERDSSVMLQTSQDALKDDPVMKMLRTFCEMSMGNVHSLVKVVTMNNFAETLVNTAKQVDAKYILVPWSGSGSIIEDAAINPVQQVFGGNRRRQSIHTLVQHASFIQDLLNTATSTVLILVDRGLDVTPQALIPNSLSQEMVPSYQQLYFPFFGGPDDRESLEIVIGLSGLDGIKIQIVRYKNIVPRRFSGDSDIGSAGSEDTIVPPEMLILDNQDDDTLTYYFGTAAKKNMFANILYSEVESYTPISTALQYLNQLSSSDLVVIGRGNTRMNNGTQFKNADAERRKVLGDVAESILLCPCHASLLVVQSSKLTTKL